MRPTRVIALTAILIAACDGSNRGGGVGTFSTAIPPDRPVNTLTGAEQNALCNDLMAFQASFAPDTCRFAAFFGGYAAAFAPGATDATIRAACTQAESACLHRPDAGAPAGMPPMCGGVSSPACTATVAEIKACIDELRRDVHAAAATVPACGTLTAGSFAVDAGTSLPGDDRPASCDTLEMKCPGFFGDPSGTPDGGAGGNFDGAIVVGSANACTIEGGTGPFPPQLCADFTGSATSGAAGNAAAGAACDALRTACGNCSSEFVAFADCATRNAGETRVGTCVVNAGQPSEQTLRFLPPTTDAQAQAYCASAGGAYTAG